MLRQAQCHEHEQVAAVFLPATYHLGEEAHVLLLPCESEKTAHLVNKYIAYAPAPPLVCLHAPKQMDESPHTTLHPDLFRTDMVKPVSLALPPALGTQACFCPPWKGWVQT